MPAHAGDGRLPFGGTDSNPISSRSSLRKNIPQIAFTLSASRPGQAEMQTLTTAPCPFSGRTGPGDPGPGAVVGPALPRTDGACRLPGGRPRAQPAAVLGVLVWGPRTPESLCRSHHGHVLPVVPALAPLRARQLLARDCRPRSEQKTQRAGRSLGSRLDSRAPPAACRTLSCPLGQSSSHSFGPRTVSLMAVDGVDPSVRHAHTGRSGRIAEPVLEQPSSVGAVLPLKSELSGRLCGKIIGLADRELF